MYIFISFPQTNPMWFQPNISQPQTGIFQPQSIYFNHKQFQSTIRYQSIFTPITTNKYRPWFVDEGRIYIYSISLLFQHIYNFYNAYTTYTLNYNLYNAYTRGVQRLYNSYIDYIIYTSSFSILFIIIEISHWVPLHQK